MGNKIATEEDYWMCTGGIMPAQMQSVQLVVLQKDDKKYLVKGDTSTSPSADFMCKWVMLIMALIAAVVAVAIVATGGAALAVIVAVGAAAGAAGAVYGSVIGSLVCGQKAAIARNWLGEKNDLMIGGQKALTTGSIMKCPVFGSKITHAPNVKNWWDALRVGLGNFGETVILGAMGGAVIGLGGAVMSGAAALAMPGMSIISNIWGSVTGWGMAARAYFGANALSNQQAMGQVDINNVQQRDNAFGNAAFPEWGSMKRIWHGQPEPMDAMLLLYFLNLRVPGKAPVPQTEEPVKPREEEGQPKDEPANAPKPANEPEPVKEGEDGKAYEEGGGQIKTDRIALVKKLRRARAEDFYLKHNPGKDLDALASELNGIDLSKPVKVIKVPPKGLGPDGNELYQFTKVNTKGEVLRGQYYTDNLNNTPSELGISDKYSVRDENWKQTDEIKTVNKENIIFDNKPVEGLKSTSKPIDDTWSLKNQSIPTIGTGDQIYIPKNQ